MANTEQNSELFRQRRVFAADVLNFIRMSRLIFRTISKLNVSLSIGLPQRTYCKILGLCAGGHFDFAQ